MTRPDEPKADDLTPEEAALLESFRALSPDDRATARLLIDTMLRDAGRPAQGRRKPR